MGWPRLSFWTLLSCLLVSVALTGRGWVDFTPMTMIWRHMRDPHLPLDFQFLLSSPFTIFLGWPVAVLTSGASAFRFVTVAGLAFFACALIWCARAISLEESWTPLFVLLAAPLPIVCARYLGKSDPFLLGFLALLMTTRSSTFQVACGAAAVACHREMGSLAVLLYGIVERDSLKACLAGVIAGNLLMVGYHGAFLANVPESRPGYAYRHEPELVEQASSHIVAHLLLSFGGFFVHLFAAVKRRLVCPEHWLAIAVAFTAAIFASDFTRVFTIVAFPALIALTAALIRSGYGNRLRQMPVAWILPLIVQFQISGFTITGPGGVF